MARQRMMLILAILSFAALLATTVVAGYSEVSVRKQIIAGGGRYASSANFAINGTLGQSVTGYAASGNHAVVAGYWSDHSFADTHQTEQIYLPLTLKTY